MENLPTGWHLDKKVPIALIVTLLFYAGTFLWWASKVENRLDVVEVKLTSQEDQLGRIIRLETQLDGISKTLIRIEEKLDRVK